MLPPDLKIIPYQDMTDIVARYIREQAAGPELKILEAGCGRMWEFSSLGIRYRLTGIDLDKDALEFRRNKQNDLDEAILSDLRTVRIAENSFDVIYSSYVLEHIVGAEAVLKNFVNWLRPGGILIVKIPDRDSLSGFLTRITPQWFHVFVYRYVKGKRMAGTPGHGPYPTFHEKILSKKLFVEFAKNNSLKVKEVCGYHNDISRSFDFLSKLIHFISFGKLNADYADIMYIFQKKIKSDNYTSRDPVRS